MKQREKKQPFIYNIRHTTYKHKTPSFYTVNSCSLLSWLWTVFVKNKNKETYSYTNPYSLHRFIWVWLVFFNCFISCVIFIIIISMFSTYFFVLFLNDKSSTMTMTTHIHITHTHIHTYYMFVIMLHSCLNPFGFYCFFIRREDEKRKKNWYWCKDNICLMQTK